MEDTDMTRTWRKSTFSSNGGANCVETASGNGVIRVRDTADREGALLTLSADAWRDFTSSLK